jgi:outer membrane receptor protein involved in Fe transport
MYNSKIKDYIEKDLTNQYSQNSELNLRGAEFDLSYNPTHSVEFDFLASYTDATDKDDKRVDGITKFLTTSSLIYTSENGLIFGSTLRYKNTKNMNNDIIFDQSISYTYKEFNIQLVGKNIFDSDIVYFDNTHDKNNPIKDARRVVLLNTSWVF